MSPDARAFGTIHTATDGREILRNTPDGWEVDEPWRWWDGPADSDDGTGGPWGNPPPGAEYGSPTLRGTSLPAVTRCVSILADPIAGMPWKVYRSREQLTAPAWITDPQNLGRDGRRLETPGPDIRLSAVEFWQQHVTSYLLWGEGITYTPRVLDTNGEPTGPIVAPIYNLHPRYVDVEAGRYYVDPEDGGEPIYLDPRELIVTRNVIRPGRERGLGAIQAHAVDLGFAADIRAYLDNLFQRGIPNGYLESTKPDLDQAMASKLKRDWMAAHGSTRKSIAVLNATTKFHPLDLDPQAMQIAKLLELSAWQIALIFGVPPSRLGISMGGSNTYQNLEWDNTVFVQGSLMPIARKLEAAIDAVLPAGQELKIDFNQMLRGDTTTRFAAYQVGIASGFLTVDEVRSFEDLPPLPANVTPPPAPGTPPPGDVVAEPPADPTETEI